MGVVTAHPVSPSSCSVSININVFSSSWVLQSHTVLGRETNTGMGVLRYFLKPPWEIKYGGPQENETELRLSLVFELAPDAVTFSFLAALKKEERKKCRM